MGVLMSCENIGHEWPGKHVLNAVSLGVNEGDRIGIVGRNGDGKSTLLAILAHEVKPDTGAVVWRNGLRVGLLGQDDNFDEQQCVREAVFGDIPQHEWASSARIRQILSALLGDVSLDTSIAELSGGQRRRCDLCRLLVEDWDILCLDEPTNHLDMRAIAWLAQHLKERWSAGSGALLVVTHDRWFLDEVALSMWEVQDRSVKPFEGGYSAYVQQRVERDARAQSSELRRQNTLRKELNWLSHGAKARTSKPKFRIKEAQELLAEDPPVRNELELKRLAVARLGKQVIEAHDVSFSYATSQTPIISHLEWLIGAGERIGILGENGAGKTTLLRLLCKQLEPSAGRVVLGASVRLGMVSQHLKLFEGKDNWTVLEILKRYRSYVVIDGKETSSTVLLERLGFEQKQTMTRLFELSGGEKRRLALLCMLLEEPNVLVLDEPGNDLDTDMLTVLEDLLDSWPATMLLVTHDRYLMERVCDDMYALHDGHLQHVPGGVDEYITKLEQHQAGSCSGSGDKLKNSSSHEGSRLSNKERQAAKRRLDALERKMPKLLDEINTQEELLTQAKSTDYAQLMSIQTNIAQLKQHYATLEDEWLALDASLEGQL